MYISHDRGISWAAMATVVGQYWSNLFVRGADVFLLGTTSDGITRGANAISLARSLDSGVTWQRMVTCVHASLAPMAMCACAAARASAAGWP